MTREEAKNLLSWIEFDEMGNALNCYWWITNGSDMTEALNMAISALTAIEKIRAEIKELSELHCIQVMDREDIPLLALEIIDKYIGGKDK